MKHRSGITDGIEIRVLAPGRWAQGHGQVHLGKNKQNAVKTMVVTDGDGRVLFCSPTQPGSCAGITHARQLGLVRLLADGPAGGDPRRRRLPGPGRPDRRTGDHTTTPQVQEERPDWYEEIHERQRTAHSSRRIRVEHGIAHLKNWRTLARHPGSREHMSDTVQAVAGLLSHQQTADLTSARQM